MIIDASPVIGMSLSCIDLSCIFIRSSSGNNKLLINNSQILSLSLSRKAVAMAFNRSVACLLVLLIGTIVEVPLQSAAKKSPPHPDGIAVEMVPYLHFMNRSLSQKEMAQMLSESSRARALMLESRIHPESSDKTDGVYQSPVTDTYVGTYVMQIRLGTPAKTFNALVDSGSNLVWIQCAPCTNCFSQPNPIFQPSQSSTYNLLPCGLATGCYAASNPYPPPCSSQNTCLYSALYAGGSLTAGDIATDNLTLISTDGTVQEVVGFTFGCGHNQQGTFGAWDGIVGFGQGILSLPSQVGPLIGNIFSYCLVGYQSFKTSTLLLGSAGPLALAYTPLITNPLYPSSYYVNVVRITVNGVALVYPASALQVQSNGLGGFLLDSGTAVTMLVTSVYSPLMTRLQSLIQYPRVDYSSYGYDLCYRLTGISNPTFPTIAFQFEGLSFPLGFAQQNILIPVSSTDKCIAFQNGNSGLSIFGNILQQNLQVAYDRANKRLGIAPTIC